MNADEVWDAFRDRLVDGKLGLSDCRLLGGEGMYRILTGDAGAALRALIRDSETPAFASAGDKLIFKLQTPAGGDVRFDFEVIGDRAFFHHLECITIPIKEISKTPFTDFSDMPTCTPYMRNEVVVSAQINLLMRLAAEKGFDEACGWLLDGQVYRLYAESWAPYFPERLAFVVYACWAEKNLWGGEPVLTTFGEDECAFRIGDYAYLDLYARSTHLRGLISKDLFETFLERIWRDRARSSDWEAEVELDKCDLSVRLVTAAGGR